MNENPTDPDTQDQTVQQDSAFPAPVAGEPLQASEPVKAGRPIKKFLAIIVILLIAAAAGAYFFTKDNKPANTQTAQNSTKLTLPDQPKQLNDQFTTQNFTAGYVNYESDKFKKIDFSMPAIDPIPAAAKGTLSEKQVIFINDATYNGTGNGHRLIMYDVDSKTTYLVDQSDKNGSYSNAAVMSNHYVVFAERTITDPLTSSVAIRSIDLNTGQSTTIMSDKASNLPESLCCSVTPDGLRMVIPQQNKFLIYQAGESKPVTLSAPVQVFPQVTGSGGGDYAASHRNYGYPSIVWLDDNRFMYAKSHPLKWTVDSQGSHAFTNNNGLAIYDLSTRQSTDVQRTSDMPINWFSVDGKTITLSTYKPNVSGIVDDNSGLTILQMDDYTSSDSIPSERLGIPLDYQSFLFYDQGAKKLYVQPTGSVAGANQDTSILDVLDTATAATSKKKIPDGELMGFIGKDQAIIDASTYGNTVYTLYDMQTGTSKVIFSNIASTQ